MLMTEIECLLFSVKDTEEVCTTLSSGRAMESWLGFATVPYLAAGGHDMLMDGWAPMDVCRNSLCMSQVPE